MKNLMTYTPEPFENLEIMDAEYDALTGEGEMEDGFVSSRRTRGIRRPGAKRAGRMPMLSKKMKPVKPFRPRVPLRPLMPAVPVPFPYVPLGGNTLTPANNAAADSSRPSAGQSAGGEGSFANAPAQDVASEHVRWVQETLNRALGLRLLVDGIMNRETRSAVRMFQERKGLLVTGLVGPDTEEALRAESGQAAAEPELLEGEWEMLGSGECACGGREFGELEALEQWEGETAQGSAQKVRWIQQSLNKILGLRLKVDGMMGLQTRSAIRSFQKKNGLVADGVVGSKTEAAMKAAGSGVQNPPTEQQSVQQATIYGWGQYKRRIEELPPDQQAALRSIGDAIIDSYKSGNSPVRTVKVYGHADIDTPRNPQREQKYSEERAYKITDWLIKYVKDTIARQIAWDTKGFGATQLKAPPVKEENRRKNRRVEVTLASTSSLPLPVCLSNNNIEKSITFWIQSNLNKLLNLHLKQDGLMGLHTRSALQLYQQRRGLQPTGVMDGKTLSAFQLDECGYPNLPGLYFKVSENSGDIYEATRRVVGDIVDQLYRYFGIATMVVEYPSCSFFNLPACVEREGYLLYLIDRGAAGCQRSVAQADAQWSSIISLVTGDCIKKLIKFRGWLEDWLKGSHQINITASIDSYHTDGRGSSIDCNPFTWWVKNIPVNSWKRTMDVSRKTASSLKAMVTMGPLMLLAHEAEHDTGKKVDGTPLPGSGAWIYEEDDVMKDINNYAVCHPHLTSRRCYSSAYCKYIELAESSNCLKYSEPVDAEWVKWPSIQQLRDGIDTSCHP